MLGIIPCAGTASRMGGIPKFLLPSPSHVTLLEQNLYNLSQMGVERIIIAVSCKQVADLIQPYLSTFTCTVVDVGRTNTMSETVKKVVDRFPASRYILMMPDTFYTLSDSTLDQFVKIKSPVSVILWCIRESQQGKLGQCNIDEAHIIQHADKTPGCTFPYSWGIISWTQDMNSDIDPTHPHVGYLIQVALSTNRTVCYSKQEGAYYDCGTYEEYFQCIRVRELEPPKTILNICLSGELKNFRPIIKNQWRMFFHYFDVRLYIYTSNRIHYRNKNIEWRVEEQKGDVVKTWLRQAYGNLIQAVDIDMDEVAFEERFKRITDHKARNMGSQIYKIVRSIQLIPKTNTSHITVRMRLDSFFLLPLHDFSAPTKDEVLLSPEYYQDGIAVTHNTHNLLHVYKTMLHYYLQGEYTHPEQDLRKAIATLGLKDRALPVQVCRIGAPTKLHLPTIPFFDETFMGDLKTDEYPECTW